MNLGTSEGQLGAKHKPSTTVKEHHPESTGLQAKAYKRDTMRHRKGAQETDSSHESSELDQTIYFPQSQKSHHRGREKNLAQI